MPHLTPPFSDLMIVQGQPNSLALYRAHTPVPYEKAIHWMENRVARIISGEASEALWFLEHPPMYTAGVRANPQDLLSPERFPVFHVGRGGQYTYHGPGQRIVYVMLNLNKRDRDLRAFVQQLEHWIVDTLQDFGVTAYIREGRVGVWIEHAPDSFGHQGESKIAAIGIRVRKWVTFHGIAINVSPNLEHFSGIVPCGISEHGVTSLAALGLDISLEKIDQVLVNKALCWG